MKRIVFLTIVLIIVLYLVFKVFQPTLCAGTLNPTLRYCDPNTSKLITGKTIPENECNPISDIEKLNLASEFIDYMKYINSNGSNELALRLLKSFPNAKIFQGSLFFAIPPLLKLLASDFGQNELTPYGIISFSDIYLKSCITNSAEFCKDVAKNPLVNVICQQYFIHLSKDIYSCPFLVTDGNPNLKIDDVGFFNLIGSLGTFSLQSTQCLLLYYDFPVGNLPLNYWSFNIYLADRLDNSKCSPFRQTYLASLAPPMNCFMTPAIAKKKFNPITGQGDVVSPSRLRFYIAVVLDSSYKTLLTDFVNQTENQMPYDFIHVFQVPNGLGSMVIDPSLPNPNKLSSENTFYNPLTDRLSLFLRLSPDPNVKNEIALKNFIYGKDPFSKPSCEVCLIDMKDIRFNQNQHQSNSTTVIVPYRQPKYIEPFINEKIVFRSSMESIISSFSSSLYQQNLSFQKLPLRNSVLNIFAPLNSSILNTKKQYLGGWQALQLAGCAQGDNPDTQYRLSGSVCLSPSDVFISVAVNHSKFGNCLYNNINIVDINKAYSVASITLTKSNPEDVYIVILGRDKSMVEHINQILSLRYSTFSTLKIATYPIILKTAPSIDGGVPMCHQLLMVERIYINMLYPSIKNSNIYNLIDVYGEDLRNVEYENQNVDAWDSLVNVCAPCLDTLIEPRFYKISKSNKIIVIVSFFILLFISCLLFFLKIKRIGSITA